MPMLIAIHILGILTWPNLASINMNLTHIQSTRSGPTKDRCSKSAYGTLRGSSVVQASTINRQLSGSIPIATSTWWVSTMTTPVTEYGKEHEQLYDLNDKLLPSILLYATQLLSEDCVLYISLPLPTFSLSEYHQNVCLSLVLRKPTDQLLCSLKNRL